MYTLKKRICLPIAAAVLMMTSLPASAASGGYVPTTANVYSYVNGKWKKEGTIKKTYDKDGKLIRQTSTSPVSVGDDTYTWDGGYLTKAEILTSGKATTETYTYSKKGFRTRYVLKTQAGTSIYVYKWKKKTASVTRKSGQGVTSSYTEKVNSKKQIISKTSKNRGSTVTTTQEYYSDGKLKKIVSKGNASGYTYHFTRKYNKDGYPTKETGTYGTVTWKYTMNKKKNCPKQVIISSTKAGTQKMKIVFTAFKKLKTIRNCDAAGREILLIPDYYIGTIY